MWSWACWRLISIHALVWGAIACLNGSRFCQWVFQSTPPVRETTPRRSWAAAPANYFNPRPPRGGRQQKQPKFQAAFAINVQLLPISPPDDYPSSPNRATYSRKTPQNLVRDCGDFLCTCASHLKHQHILRVVRCLCPKMFDLVLIAVSQIIKAQTVLSWVHDLTQLCL